MDDTIFDHVLTCQAALRALRRSEPLFRRRPLLEVRHEYLRLLDAVHTDILAGRTSVDAARIERFRRLAEFCGGSVSEVRARSLSRRYRAQYQRERRAVPGAVDLLTRLHGRSVVTIVTNNQVAEQEGKLDFLGIRPLVDFLVVSEGVGVSKPDRRIFEIALERSDAGPEEAVMVGDSWPSDIVGARGAGIRAIWFNRFGLPNPDPRDVAEIRSMRDHRRVEEVLAEARPTPVRPSPE